MNQSKLVCPYCEEETIFAKYCGICGKQIAYDCPVCDNIHLKGTIYCQNSGNSLESYKKLLEMIIDLLNNFESSEEYKKFSRWQFNLLSTASISFLLVLVFGIVGVAIHGQAQTYTETTIFGGVFLLSFICVANLGKNYRHALERYLVARGLPKNNLFKNVTYYYRHNRYGYLKDQIALCKMILKPVKEPSDN